MTSSFACAQTPMPKNATVVDNLLECAIFYETHGAFMAQQNKPSQVLWDKSDIFKRHGIEKAQLTQSLSEQEIQTRTNYLVKKWSKLLLSTARSQHKKTSDLKTWTRFCDSLGEGLNILPLNN